MDTAVPHNVGTQNCSVERIDIVGICTVFKVYRWNRK